MGIPMYPSRSPSPAASPSPSPPPSFPDTAMHRAFARRRLQLHQSPSSSWTARGDDWWCPPWGDSGFSPDPTLSARIEFGARTAGLAERGSASVRAVALRRGSVGREDDSEDEDAGGVRIGVLEDEEVEEEMGRRMDEDEHDEDEVARARWGGYYPAGNGVAGGSEDEYEFWRRYDFGVERISGRTIREGAGHSGGSGIEYGAGVPATTALHVDTESASPVSTTTGGERDAAISFLSVVAANPTPRYVPPPLRAGFSGASSAPPSISSASPAPRGYSFPYRFRASEEGVAGGQSFDSRFLHSPSHTNPSQIRFGMPSLASDPLAGAFYRWGAQRRGGAGFAGRNITSTQTSSQPRSQGGGRDTVLQDQSQQQLQQHQEQPDNGNARPSRQQIRHLPTRLPTSRQRTPPRFSPTSFTAAATRSSSTHSQSSQHHYHLVNRSITRPVDQPAAYHRQFRPWARSGGGNGNGTAPAVGGSASEVGYEGRSMRYHNPWILRREEARSARSAMEGVDVLATDS